MRIPRVIASDLDGTLLCPDGTISTQTAATLQAVERLGIEVVFVTARPPRWLAGVTHCVAQHGHIICLGGACVLDVSSGTVVESTGFTAAEIHLLAGRLRAAIPRVGLGAERVDGGSYEYRFQYPQAWAAAEPTPVTELDAIEDGLAGPWPVAKLLARCPGLDSQDFLDQAAAAAEGLAHFAYSGAGALAEFLPLTITKATALARWCHERGLTADDVWAFGDMPNDVPMLEWAGRSWAMGNAHEAARAAATDQTLSHADDGVAVALQQALSLNMPRW